MFVLIISALPAPVIQALLGFAGVIIGVLAKYIYDRKNLSQHAPIDAATALLTEAQAEKTEADGFAVAVSAVLNLSAELQKRLDAQATLNAQLQEEIISLKKDVAEIPSLKSQIREYTELIKQYHAGVEILIAQVKEFNAEPHFTAPFPTGL